MGLDVIRGVVMFVAALAPAGVAVFRHLGHGLRLTERFLLAVTLAPVAVALPALALALAFHLPIDWCLWQAEFVWIVAALWPRGVRAAPVAAEPLPERGHGFPSIAAVTTALVAALLVAGVALAVPMVRMWSDAWFHAGAAIEVARHGVPPQDPNFAGVPFFYFWVYHFLLALLGAATGLSPFHQMALINAWSAVVLVLAAAQLTYRVFGRAAAMWVGAIAVLGLTPLGWLYWVGRGIVGDTRGLMPMLEQLGSTNGAATALSWLFPPSHVSLLNRFWTGTALTPAIALGVATAWGVARALHQPTRLAWLRLLALALSLFVVHPAYAAFAVASVALGLVPVVRAGERRGAAVAALVALGLAGLAGMVYGRACTVPGAATSVMPGFYLRNVLSLLLAVGPWWIVLAPAVGVAWGRGAPGRFAVGVAAAAVAIAMFLVLPEANSDKFFYLAWVSLVPLVAAGVMWWGDHLRLPGVARLAIVAALIVPTAGLYTIGTASDRRSPGVLIRGDRAATRPLPLATGAERGVYHFIRDRSPADAVVIEKPRPTVNEPVPVLAERRVFCGSLDVYLANHFRGGKRPSEDLQSLLEEFRVRRDIQLALFGEGVLNEAQRVYLGGFTAPLYLIVRRSEVADPVWEGFRWRPEWDEEIANEQMRLYRYAPPPILGPVGPAALPPGGPPASPGPSFFH